MNKELYFKQAIQAKAYRYKAWWISAFSLSTHKKGPRPYFIERRDNITGFFNSELQWTPIENHPIDQPVLRHDETITLDSLTIPSLKVPTLTTYGNALINLCLLIETVGIKLPYINTPKSIASIEEQFILKLTDTVPSDQKLPDRIYVDDYLKFGESVDFIQELSPLFTISSTPKTMLPPPGAEELLEKLVAEAGDKINDPVEFKKIENQLMALADTYLKDDPTYKKFLSGKALDNSYRSRFLVYGIGASFDPNVPSKPILTRLYDGVPTDPDTLTSLINGVRVASYSRAKETVKGGVVGKWLVRWASGFKMAEKNCDTTQGLSVVIEPYLTQYLVGSQIKEDDQWIWVEDLGQAKTYIGQTVEVRSAGYCRASTHELCPACLGKTIALNPRGLNTAAMENSFTLLTAALKSMHQVGVIKVATMNPSTSFS